MLQYYRKMWVADNIEVTDMTFKKFEELFKTKYPYGSVCRHGDFGGTEKNNKIAVAFDNRPTHVKAYLYYGAYEDVLKRVGILVVSRARLYSMEQSLESLKEGNGKRSIFGVADFSRDIATLEAEIEEIKATHVIV